MINIANILFKISKKKFVFLFKKQPIFPFYHLVGEGNLSHFKHLYSYKTEKQFNDDLDFLLKNYIPLHPKDLLENKIMPNSFLLSFDDGLKEIYTKIYPILKSRGLSAIFFINPNFVDNKDALYRQFLSISFEQLVTNGFKVDQLNHISNILEFKYSNLDDFKTKFFKLSNSNAHKTNLILEYLNFDKEKYLKENILYISSEEIQEMINDDFYFGGHTMSHPFLQQLNIEEQESEIIDSIDWVKKKFNIEYSLFAFPFTDFSLPKALFNKIISKFDNIKIFGTAGIMDDFHPNIVQRISSEDPKISIGKNIVYQNLNKYSRKFRFKNKIVRQ